MIKLKQGNLYFVGKNFSNFRIKSIANFSIIGNENGCRLLENDWLIYIESRIPDDFPLECCYFLSRFGIVYQSYDFLESFENPIIERSY